MEPDTLLLRQIHPRWIKVGRATSQAFKPTAKDEDHLSVHDGDQIDPRAAWIAYTAQGRESTGVMAVTVAEAHQQSLGVAADPTPDTPEHVVIDFTSFSPPQTKRVARALTRNANDRGWQYQPANSI